MKFINCCMIHYAWLICKPFTTTMSQQQSTDTGKNEGKNLTLRKSMSDRTYRAAAFLTSLLLKATSIRSSSSTCSSLKLRTTSLIPPLFASSLFPFVLVGTSSEVGNSRSSRAVTAAASAGRSGKGAAVACQRRRAQRRAWMRGPGSPGTR